MNWCDERYVRVYVRDTADLLALSFEAQGLLWSIMRKVDRSGVLELGRHGKKAVAIAIGHANRWDVLEPALEELLVDGCVVLDGARLVMPNFIEAQEAVQSDRMRQAESRARRRELSHNDVTKRDGESQNVTESHAASQPVTDCHTESQSVTPCLAVPSVLSRAEPSVPKSVRAAPEPSADALDVATYLLEAIRSHKPDAKDGSKGWARDIDLAIRQDGRTVERLRAVIDFAHRSQERFWRGNLLSGSKLREHCERLEIQARTRGASGVRVVGTGDAMSPNELADWARKQMDEERKAGLR